MPSPKFWVMYYWWLWKSSAFWPSRANFKSGSMSLVRSFFTSLGYTVFSTSDLVERERKFSMGDVDLDMVGDVKLLSLRVWTEGDRPCVKHVYHKVRTPNSHRNASTRHNGKSEHLDYICAICTHGMCDTKWADNA
jgi:hypothetical protein